MNKEAQHRPEIPLVMGVAVQAEAPSLADNTADIDRLRTRLRTALPGELGQRPLIVSRAVTPRLARAFREQNFSGTALLAVLPHEVQLMDLLPPGRGGPFFGMALDLGTTHLEASLVDLVTGRSIHRAHGVNRQVEYGADILSRIHYATGKNGDSDGLARLQEEAVTSINRLADDLAARAGIRTGEILAMSVSGNTTMVHLLLGLDPYHICREPYIPLVNAPDPLRAAEVGLNLHPRALLWILPSIGSYFGGDLVSGILASGLDTREETAMLIDVGTNAEVVLGNREWLIACAGAAGPALEGGVARMGMRAGPGAIEHVRLDREKWRLHVQTIDDAPAAGICGSGLIDLVAELYLARIVDLRGKLVTSTEEESGERRRFLERHLTEADGEAAFLVTPAEESAHGRPVLLTQVDLDAMMRSKAAMYAILTTLVGQVGVGFGDLERIYVAGAFGKHIDPRAAITLGMLPDLDLSVYQPLGNSSLAGAELILLSEAARLRSREIRRRITYIELNVNQEFMIRFSGSRFIPHTDPSLFPSVPVFGAGTGT